MRLFVALTPPDEVIDELLAGTAVLRDMAPELRWTPPAQWHLTLAFLGAVQEKAIGELTRRLGRAAARHPPLELSLGGGGRFGHRVLWIRVQEDRPGLHRLVDSVRAAARHSGLPVEQRPYRPHLTLARTNGVVDLQPLVERLTAGPRWPWTATRLSLIASLLGAGPAGSSRHETQADWPLEGSPHRASTWVNSWGT